MYKKIILAGTQIKRNESVEGEPIEGKIRRYKNNGEPIGEDGAGLIYTERKDGVLAGYNIKTDRFEVALEAMDSIHRSSQAKRDARIEAKKEKDNVQDESIQGTE